MSYHTHSVVFQSIISIVHSDNAQDLFSITSNQAQTVLTVTLIQVLNLVIQFSKSHISMLHVLIINSGWSI
ncbi:hypothetical protein HOF65_00445 [bacterium]|nr:hypothetical protein [bacterium]MBT3852518.1 hypothetical protein [bacterium]MBT4632683.1 hypothetical protein [bacterium]MBT6778296.1 hypothetical protein [bacterium]